MACIIKKVKRGRAYYYAAESARKNGGPPRIVWQKYLGTLDDIVQRTEVKSSVKEVVIFQAGGVAAMLRIIQRIGLIEIVDEVVPKRDQGPSVGQYIAMAMINRIVEPCSKLAMSEWYKKTVLYRLWMHPEEAFSSQRFWDHMHLISDDQLEEIQRRVSVRVRQEFSLGSDVILYDTTNFFTYVAGRNKRNTIAKRGHNKAKRNDLRQVGLALLVTKDLQIPLFHHVYEGNRPDRGIFPEIASKMKDQFDSVYGTQSDSTLVFDKGNVSHDAMENLIVSRQHFVCAVPKNTMADVFSTPSQKLQPVPGLTGTKSHRCKVELWNKTLTVVLTYSESYFSARLADLTEAIQKCEKKLNDLNLELSVRLKTPSQRPLSLSQVRTRVKAILSDAHLGEIFQVTVKMSKGAPQMCYNIDHGKIDYIMKHELGRTILVSSRDEWNDKEIISTYRGQSAIEEAFKRMKNKDYLHWQPAFHWTDSKIKVHGLYCVLALLVATLAHKLVVDDGIEMSMFALLDELNDIREVALIHDNTKKAEKTKSNRDSVAISRMSGQQRKLAEVLEIGKVLCW